MKRENLSPLAMRLRMLRKQHNMTQADVAKELNLHRTTYTKYETDKASPDQTCLMKLAKLFGVTVDFLLGEDGEDSVDILQDNVTVVALSPEEKELIAAFRQLTEAQRQLLLQTERELLGVTREEE